MTGLALSERQRATVAAALTMFSVAVIVVLIGFLLWLVGAFLSAFSGVFLPLATAGILALVANPYFHWLTNRCGGRRLPALLLLYASLILPIVLIGWFFGAKVAAQIHELIVDATALIRKLDLQSRWPDLVNLWNTYIAGGEDLSGTLQSKGAMVVPALQKIIGGTVSVGATVYEGVMGLMNWIVVPVYLAFFLLAKPTSDRQPEEYLPFLKPTTRGHVIFLVREFISIIVAFFRGQLIIALLQGVLFAIGFTLIGLPYGFILGLILGFLNIIPYLGSLTGLAVALPLAFLQQGGGIGDVALVLAVFTAVQCIEGYILTPKIMGDTTGLHPMAIMVAIFFWGTALGGIAGMVFAIPLTAFLVVFWRLAKTNYIPEVV